MPDQTPPPPTTAAAHGGVSVTERDWNSAWYAWFSKRYKGSTGPELEVQDAQQEAFDAGFLAGVEAERTRCLEVACRAVCVWCDMSPDVVLNDEGDFHYGVEDNGLRELAPCEAQHIRAAFAQQHELE